MAKAHQLIEPNEVTREHLLGIPGVGARNVTALETRLASFFADQRPSDMKVEDIAESGVISESAAEEVVAWVQRHVKDEGGTQVVPTEEIFEEEDGEEDVAPETNGHGPVFALAFDPAEAIEEASILLEDYPDAPYLHHRLDAVSQWLRGEVAPYQKA